MDLATGTTEDPLIVALPPATDYMTYLTLLEYQLKPENLPTLNRLLSDDDGTLAAEIGWDVLKLVLPMLQIIPEEASTCLSIIARRGNPREVVVRVAEELERLGQQDGGSDFDEEELDQDGLPTFTGEAPPVHLGELKLDDTPSSTEHLRRASESREPVAHDRRSSIGAEPGSDDILFLQALLSMLGILHPRIKTQFPSRFLATSLPAALSAYRRVKVTPETTLAFANLLSKLSGKQRPTLPPRTSTASGIPIATAISPSVATSASNVQAPPLPDPEAKPDSSSVDVDSQANEKAIIQRLLQAVMLEVLDEYSASFQFSDDPSMNWTGRLREKHEPRRVLPNRPTETQRWAQSEELRSRDETLVKFLNLAKNLNLDVGREINQVTHATDDPSSQPIDDMESEYPTSPSQIPFPTSGLMLLFAAHSFALETTGLTALSPLPLAAVQSLFQATFAPSQDLPHPPSLAQTDALLSLMYTTAQSVILQPPQPQHESSLTSSAINLPFLTNLTNLFTTSPDPSIRDSAHHLTGLLLHNHTTAEVKLLYIKSLLSPHQSPASPIHDIQRGNLQALAITWLKDEFLSYSNTHDFQTPQPPTTVPISASANPGLDPHLVHSDPDLAALIFPTLPVPPGPFIIGHPAAALGSARTSDSSNSTPVLSNETDFESLLLMIPSYISALNLICILAALPSFVSSTHLDTSHEHEHEQEHVSILSANRLPISESSIHNAVSSNQSPLISRASQFLDSVTAWKTLLVDLAASVTQNKKLKDGNSGPMSVTDVYALEDAVERAKVVMAHESEP